MYLLGNVEAFPTVSRFKLKQERLARKLNFKMKIMRKKFMVESGRRQIMTSFLDRR